LGVVGVIEAYDKHDMGGVVGSGLVAAGGVGSGVSFVMLMAESSLAGPVAIIGFALVEFGHAIIVIYGDHESPYHKLVDHCEWGKRGTLPDDGDDQPDWSPAPYKAWKGNYDLQLRAALSVVCIFSFKWKHLGRELKLSM